MSHFRFLLISLAICVVAARAGFAAPDAVYNAVTGDMIAVTSENGRKDFRVRGIYAPYLQQNFGKEARQFLETRLKTGKVVIEECREGKCDVLVDGVSVASLMVESGHAWADTKVARNGLNDFQEVYGNPLFRLEKQARSQKIGLWSEAQPVPPWLVAYLYDKEVLEHNDISRCNRGYAVVLYVTSWCPWCKKAENFFSSRGIRYISYDIEADEDAAWCKNQIAGRSGVPVAVINGRKVTGYSESQYLQALGQER